MFDPEIPDESHASLGPYLSVGELASAQADSLRRQVSMLAQNNLDLRQLLHEAYDRLMPIPGHVAFCNTLRAELTTSSPPLPES